MAKVFAFADDTLTRGKREDRSPILNESLADESGDENVFVGPDDEDSQEEEEEEGLKKRDT